MLPLLLKQRETADKRYMSFVIGYEPSSLLRKFPLMGGLFYSSANKGRLIDPNEIEARHCWQHPISAILNKREIGVWAAYLSK